MLQSRVRRSYSSLNFSMKRFNISPGPHRNNNHKNLFIQTGTAGSMFSITAPITKVVKNDAYTAPQPPVPVPPTRPNTSTAAARSSAAALQPVSRTLQQSAAETSTAAPSPPQVPAAADVHMTVLLSHRHPPLTCLHFTNMVSDLSFLWGIKIYV